MEHIEMANLSSVETPRCKFNQIEHCLRIVANSGQEQEQMLPIQALSRMPYISNPNNKKKEDKKSKH